MSVQTILPTAAQTAPFADERNGNGQWPEDVHLIGCGGPQRGGLKAAGHARAQLGDERATAIREPGHTDAALVAQIGFKAYGLSRMAALGLPVPPAFVLGTGYCSNDSARRRAVERAVWGPPLQRVEKACGQRFGDPRRPLLVAVRSGAPVSMPGMLDTLLDIGLCDATVPGFLRQTGNPRLVWDTYRRLVASYGELIDGISPQVFADEYAALTGAAGMAGGSSDERGAPDFALLRQLTRRYLAAYERAAGRPFPQAPEAQLAGAIGAVLASWQSEKAVAFRRHCAISEDVGTAVTVQAMAFGNGGGRSGAGVGFTRDPSTGERAPWVDFLFNAQGEDVVSGRREAFGHDELARVMPAVWDALRDAASRLEQAFGDMQDFEFTVQDGRLFLLQTRSGKRTPQAAAQIALDLLDEGVIDASTARARTAAIAESALARTHVVSACNAGRHAAGDDAGGAQPLVPLVSLVSLARAASATNGVATGEIALDEPSARERHAAGRPVILVRRDADTHDLVALQAAAGLLTRRGARTSHAAVVARQLGKVCLTGCEALQIDDAARTVQIGGRTFNEGDTLTLDGNEGAIYAGETRTVTEPLTELRTRLARLRSA
ncbi:PEP/pyruvate-binding domain-containing protein [Paraburkholderia kururiensis]|uniref:PEP/pyruvate-binding domain-containing protein n=1 Tax=Paraburkholderia kururiensis TaxID=984307 RepID=UPI000694E02B|nr:PEP/pyruvate-binding domain-containing protein [Paraburkholderia kururiensis]